MSAPAVFLLDVEGTTTPVAFVYDVLFPYARARLADFLRERREDPEVRADLARLRREHRNETNDPPPWRDETPAAGRDSAVAYVHYLMDRDRKSTGLKSLQGRIWEAGYRSGALRGSVYPDVAPAFARWTAGGAQIATFSSGSVLAQRLLFGHSTSGDLLPFLRACFDTTTGPKVEATSYARIAAALGRTPRDVLFVSDVERELEAARAAGLRTALCVRPGRPEPAREAHAVVRSFDDVDALESAGA